MADEQRWRGGLFKGLHLEGESLERILVWTDVLAFAGGLVTRAVAAHANIGLRLALTHVDLRHDMAMLFFERRIGGRDNRVEQRPFIQHAVSLIQVTEARHPIVWQGPMEAALQRLIAEVPALGYTVFEPGDLEGSADG
jgi:hypothetical protein